MFCETWHYLSNKNILISFRSKILLPIQIHFVQIALTEEQQRLNYSFKIDSGGSRIFPVRGGVGGNPRRDCNLLFGIIFAENCMETKKKIGMRGALSLAPLDPPLVYNAYLLM